jgi:glycerol-3-phosphate cytidylyltransferase
VSGSIRPEQLLVGISTDEFNTVKGKTTLIPYEQRAEIVSNIKCVDSVFPEENWEQKVDDIRKFNVDIFAMGSDWEGEFDFLKEYCEVSYFDRTSNISTTKLKGSLSNFLSISKKDILAAFEIIEALKKDFE